MALRVDADGGGLVSTVSLGLRVERNMLARVKGYTNAPEVAAAAVEAIGGSPAVTGATGFIHTRHVFLYVKVWGA